MNSPYKAAKRLARDHPDWLPIVEGTLECAKEYGEFAGSWVLDKARKKGIKWFPGLRIFVRYGILKHEETTRSGRRAYYTKPVPQGVENALQEFRNIKWNRISSTLIIPKSTYKVTT